jgi:hypothetical protein
MISLIIGYQYARELLPSSLLEQVKKNPGDYETIKEVLTEYQLTALLLRASQGKTCR